MGNMFAVLTPLLHGLVKLAGLTPQTIEIEPGTWMKIWVPKDIVTKKDGKIIYVPPTKPAVVLLHSFAMDGLEKLRVENVIVVGLSYGGMVGFKMAKLYPKLVKSFVASGTVIEMTESISLEAYKRLDITSWSDLLMPETATFTNRKERNELLASLVVPDEDAASDNYSQMIHMLWGDDDKIFNSDLARTMKQQLGENTTLDWIKDAGHLAPLEQPFAYNKRLKYVLEREAALNTFPETTTDANKTAALKTGIHKKAHNALILCLDNKVLSEVNKVDFVAGIWLKLETLYMTKSLANKLYLKKKLFTFYMHSGGGRIIGVIKDVAVLRSNSKGQGSSMHYEGHDNGDLLMSMSGEMFLEWIMNSDGSYHMTPRRDFLFDFKEFNGGTVLPSDNRACVLKRNLISLGTLDREGYTVKLWNGRIKVIKGSLMVFSGTMKENYEYSLDDLVASSEASFEKREVLGNKGLGKLEVCKNYVLGKSTRDFNNLCKESGISKHLTVAGTLQHNGLAERMNRSPSSALEKKKPMGKLKPRSIKCIFLGYPDGVKGCRLWRLDDVKPKIIISMDVVFNESLMYKDTLKGVGATDSRKKVEFEMELKGSKVEATVNPHTGENPGNEDKEQDNEEPQQ
ncbi:retrovirus-related pol polyprotein from transposon TNT 1-94 [Tanacetum coccineum]